MPIFADTATLVRSIRRLKEIPGLLHYLPGHDQPAEGAALYRKSDDLIANIRRFHAAVKKAALEAIGKPDPQAIAVRVFASLNLPPAPGPINRDDDKQYHPCRPERSRPRCPRLE